MNRHRPDARATLSSHALHLRTRRGLLTGCLAAFFALSFVGCSTWSTPTDLGTDARLTARPHPPTLAPALGESALGIEPGRDGLLYVPADYDASRPAPLVVLLHGAGGAAGDWRGVFDRLAARGFVTLALDSRGTTWDRARGDFGVDVAFIDAALSHTFDRYAIDASRILLAGFSDGASYALSLGVGNGDLFTHLTAFSPGFLHAQGAPVGQPRIFISHGTEDSVLPIQASRESIVPLLRSSGYDVRYEEFEGGHAVPGEIFDAAMDWFVT